MENFKSRLKIVFLPSVVVLFLFAPVYTILHWFILTRYNDFGFNNIVFDLWVPLVVGVMVLYVLVWPGWKGYSVRNIRGNGPMAFIVLLLFSIIFNTPDAQSLLRSFIGKDPGQYRNDFEHYIVALTLEIIGAFFMTFFIDLERKKPRTQNPTP